MWDLRAVWRWRPGVLSAHLRRDLGLQDGEVRR
jgi:PSP